MAGDWIKMRMDLPDDPAVFKLAALTQLDRHSILGRLYAFWSWADKHAVDGRVDGATSQVVDAVVQFDGFAAALQAVKWLDVGEDFLGIPKYERHNGEPSKERSLKNQRQARWRGRRRDGDVTAPTRPSTRPSTREEKRRSKPPISPQPGFERFWAAWPNSERKEAKGECAVKWEKGGFEAQTEAIIAHVDSLKASSRWRDGFIVAPAVYLNQRRWEGANAAREQQQLKVAL